MQMTREAQPGSKGEVPTEPALSPLLIVLLKGILYQETSPKRWNDLLLLQNQVRDFVGILHLELIVDEAEGYAFLRTFYADETNENTEIQITDPNSDTIPRLVVRRQLSFPISLLLALLRKKLAEFDASGSSTRLVLTRSNIVDMIQLFIPQSTNEAKVLDDIERHINKVIELGFLRRLSSNNAEQEPHYEVKRIIKAFIDAQWLSAFDEKLDSYQQYLAN